MGEPRQSPTTRPHSIPFNLSFFVIIVDSYQLSVVVIIGDMLRPRNHRFKKVLICWAFEITLHEQFLGFILIGSTLSLLVKGSEWFYNQFASFVLENFETGGAVFALLYWQSILVLFVYPFLGIGYLSKDLLKILQITAIIRAFEIIIKKSSGFYSAIVEEYAFWLIWQIFFFYHYFLTIKTNFMAKPAITKTVGLFFVSCHFISSNASAI